MGIVFTESRALPKQFKNDFGHYRGFGESNWIQDVGGVVSAASPWNFLTGWLVDKPRAEAEAQVQMTALQAQAFAQQEEQKAKTMRTVLIAGAGLAGVLVLMIAMKPRRSMGGYRRSRRHRSRR